MTPNNSSQWNFWNTLGYALIIFICYVLLQIGGSIGFLATVNFIKVALSQTPEIILSPTLQGLSLSLTEIISVLFCTLLTLKIAKKKLQPQDIKDFFGFQWPASSTTLRWLAISCPVVLLIDFWLYYLQYPFPQFMIEVGILALAMPLVYVTLVVLPPIFEEILFRGFILQGLRQSPFKDTGAIFFSAFLFAIIHTQYSDIYLVLIFAIGVVLAYARVKTGSLYLAMLLHGLYNGFSMLEITLYLWFTA